MTVDSWLAGQMDTVPELTGFLNADQLEAALLAIADEFPEVATRRRIGTSRLGDAIHALQIGDGPQQALVFALPHPNEPIGGLTAIHLARQLCRDADLRQHLGLRFTIVACIDPDGLRLNEGWLDGPFTRTHYSQHFYRPAGHEQVEWTFPLDHKRSFFDAVLPETLAIMRLIDELKPALMCSLHNSELGGAYYYLSRAEPALYEVLQAVPQYVGVPLDRGEPEHPSIPQLADGIFHGMSIVSTIDYMESQGLDISDVKGGDCSSSYAARYGTLTLLSEVPYWTDPRSTDGSPINVPYVDLIALQCKQIANMSSVLNSVLDAVVPTMSTSSPFLSASKFFIPGFAEFEAHQKPRLADPANVRPATVAEQFSMSDTVHSFRLRFGGMLLRALDGEIAIGNGRKVIREQRAVLARIMRDWYGEADAAGGGTVLPIGSLVATQYGAILATSRHVGGNPYTA